MRQGTSSEGYCMLHELHYSSTLPGDKKQDCHLGSWINNDGKRDEIRDLRRRKTTAKGELMTICLGEAELGAAAAAISEPGMESKFPTDKFLGTSNQVLNSLVLRKSFMVLPAGLW